MSCGSPWKEFPLATALGPARKRRGILAEARGPIGRLDRRERAVFAPAPAPRRGGPKAGVAAAQATLGRERRRGPQDDRGAAPRAGPARHGASTPGARIEGPDAASAHGHARGLERDPGAGRQGARARTSAARDPCGLVAGTRRAGRKSGPAPLSRRPATGGARSGVSGAGGLSVRRGRADTGPCGRRGRAGGAGGARGLAVARLPLDQRRSIRRSGWAAILVALLLACQPETFPPRTTRLHRHAARLRSQSRHLRDRRPRYQDSFGDPSCTRTSTRSGASCDRSERCAQTFAIWGWTLTDPGHGTLLTCAGSTS